MHSLHNHTHSFVIQVANNNKKKYTTSNDQGVPHSKYSNYLSTMKLFNSFRKILMRLIFALPPRGSSGTSAAMSAPRQRNSCDRSFDPPKTSCSSYYSSHSHYNEAIADCIEFFNKSSQDGCLDARKSDVMV